MIRQMRSMMSENLEEQHSRRLSTTLHTLMIVTLQSILFFGAATAITLFYLSYRPGNFLQTAIATSILMIPPWFIVSLLPTLFGLRDTELKTEILGIQLLCLLFIAAVLVALAVGIDYHPVLFDQGVAWFEKSLAYLKETLAAGLSLVQNIYSDVRIFLTEMFDSFTSVLMVL
jgi:hypothetical protein